MCLFSIIRNSVFNVPSEDTGEVKMLSQGRVTQSQLKTRRRFSTSGWNQRCSLPTHIHLQHSDRAHTVREEPLVESPLSLLDNGNVCRDSDINQSAFFSTPIGKGSEVHG